MTRVSIPRYLLLVMLYLLSTSLLAQSKENESAFSIEHSAGNSIGNSTEQAKTSVNKNLDITLRLGQGGFRDKRSPLDKLGGGQLTIDIKSVVLPIAISLTSEYYTNSAEPTHSYEIAGMFAANLLYVNKFFNIDKMTYFAGGGPGWLEVPASEENPDEKIRSGLVNIEAGIHVRAFWKIGFYGVAKYLYAQKKVDDVKIVNFNEAIVLLGVTYNFSL